MEKEYTFDDPGWRDLVVEATDGMLTFARKGMSSRIDYTYLKREVEALADEWSKGRAVTPADLAAVVPTAHAKAASDLAKINGPAPED